MIVILPVVHSFIHSLTHLYTKERVEEDRFMREQEKKFFEQKKQELTQQKDVDEFQNKIAPAMAEAMAVLKDAGDTTVVSDKGLEALARWKLGL